MKTKGLMTTFGILIVILSVVGVAYAAWMDTVKIEGKVYTGDFLVGWYKDCQYQLTWTETTNGVPEEQFDDAKPWVANATVLLKEPERSKCSECSVTVYHSMRVRVYNAYPQWDLHITAWLKNAGTVPSKLCPNFKLHFADVTDGENLTYTLNTPYYDGDHWVYTGTVNDPVAGAIMNFVMYLYVPEDTQMEPCDVHKVEISVDFTQQLEECHKYDFSVEMTFIQWSKIAECPA